MEIVSKLLGHSSMKITQDSYEFEDGAVEGEVMCFNDWYMRRFKSVLE